MSEKTKLPFLADSNEVDFRISYGDAFQPGKIVSGYKEGNEITYLIDGRAMVNGTYTTGIHIVKLTGPKPNIRLR